MLRDLDDWARAVSAIYLRAAVHLAATAQIRPPPPVLALSPRSWCAELRVDIGCRIDQASARRGRATIRVEQEDRDPSTAHLLSVVADPDGVALLVDGRPLTRRPHAPELAGRGDAVMLPRRGVFLVAEADTPTLARIVAASRRADGERRLA